MPTAENRRGSGTSDARRAGGGSSLQYVSEYSDEFVGKPQIFDLSD